MPPHIRDDVELARRCAQSTAFTFAGNAHPRSSINACGNAHLHVFSFWQNAFAFAQRARRTTFAAAATVRTLLTESQTATGALHLASAFACRTSDDRTASVARAMTTRTLFRSIDCEIGCETCYRFFKTQRKRHLNIRAALRLWPRCFALSFCAAKQISEDVAEAAAA